jgi:hypothetical protein
MNERIKQLAEQAGMIIVDDKFSTYGKFAEKFAELIVRECAVTAGLMEHEGRKGIGAQILDNFGVKK